MRKLTDADRVWNRACYREGDNLREGDRALGALLLVHGYIMNGGVGHGAQDLATDELAAGIAAYRFFGLDEMVAIIERFQPRNQTISNSCDKHYYELGTRFVREHFDRMYISQPDQFAPVASTYEAGLGGWISSRCGGRLTERRRYYEIPLNPSFTDLII